MAAQEPVKAARKRVDELNATHYRLLKDREQVTESMRENSAELATALEELQSAEQAASVAAGPDLSGAVAPKDPPATKRVKINQASESSKAGGGRG